MVRHFPAKNQQGGGGGVGVKGPVPAPPPPPRASKFAVKNWSHRCARLDYKTMHGRARLHLKRTQSCARQSPTLAHGCNQMSDLVFRSEVASLVEDLRIGVSNGVHSHPSITKYECKIPSQGTHMSSIHYLCLCHGYLRCIPWHGYLPMVDIHSILHGIQCRFPWH